MGLKDKLKKYNEEHKEDGFHPLDLNEGNVRAIFDRCLAKEDTKEISYSFLYLKVLGYEKEDTWIKFDKRKLLENKRTLEYLVGQLLAVHQDKIQVTKEELAVAYTKKAWTDENASYIMQLLYLCSAGDVKITNRFIKEFDTISFHYSLQPTLSPKDPKFAEWWEEHKAEWET